jgi:hypothetical protein
MANDIKVGIQKKKKKKGNKQQPGKEKKPATA